MLLGNIGFCEFISLFPVGYFPPSTIILFSVIFFSTACATQLESDTKNTGRLPKCIRYTVCVSAASFAHDVCCIYLTYPNVVRII